MSFKNWLLFVLVVLLWGSNWTAIKVGMSFASWTTLALHRFVIAAAILTPIVFLRPKKIAMDRDTVGKLLLYSLIYASQIITMQIGLAGESSGISAVLTYTSPLFVYCLAIPFLREKTTALGFLGALIGFLGVIILLADRASSLTLHWCLVLVFSGFLWAVAIVYYKKFLSHVDPLVANFSQLSMVVLPSAALCLVTNSFVLPRETTYVWITLYCSVGSLVIGSAVWLFLLKEEEATILSGSSFLIPVAAVFFGWQLLGENVQIESALGSTLVLLGMYLVNSKRHQANQGHG